ncbi:YaaC family protein [Caldalkalibacillus thermarum]|nr:YaaC family protein [Caldalkalibacillus thermarum]
MKVIASDHAWTKMKQLLLFFANESQAKQHLFRCYRQLTDEKEAERLAYANTFKFIYFLKQGETYFTEAEQCARMVKPLLLFYGMASFKKALILLYDPEYPKTTRVLQHGLTTRKKKKLDYLFSADEVKMQKDGLLPYFSKRVLKQPLIINEKYKVKTLLSQCPELQNSCQLLFQTQTFIPVEVPFMPTQLKENRCPIKINPRDLRALSIDLDHLQHLLGDNKYTIERIDQEKEMVVVKLLAAEKGNKGFVQSWADVQIQDGIHPRLSLDYQGQFHLYVGPLPSITHEFIIYHMVMYVLSMLCRYDTEAWGELLFSFGSQELFVIDEFLTLVQRKYPNLILNHLFGEYLLFQSP